MLIGLGGCAASPPDDVPDGAPAWRWRDLAGRVVATAHYRIFTTVADEAFLHRFADQMEHAYARYTALCPPTEADAPLEIDLFATADEWRRFTVATAGPEAAVYVQVAGGGYAIGDRFVCWLSDEPRLLSVAAHEGFHQYVARHCAERLPPALEEGLATTFETDDAPNSRRRQGLVRAAALGRLIPLETLIQMHAGDVVGGDSTQAEGFYSQCWALARLILETPRYRTGLPLMLHDLQQGHPRVSLGPNSREGRYRPANVKPLLQAYLAPDWRAFESDYQRAIQQFTSPTSR